MPTYQYRCADCGGELEVVQKFTDPSLTECPTCQGNLRKVFNAVGVVFKGSGFYATDNRSKGKGEAAKPAAAGSDAPAPAAQPTPAKADAKPAPTKPAASPSPTS